MFLLPVHQCMYLVFERRSGKCKGPKRLNPELPQKLNHYFLGPDQKFLKENSKNAKKLENYNS